MSNLFPVISTSAVDMNQILQAISTVGFPIVGCVALFYQNWKEGKAHKEEMNQLTKALENNTLAIQKMVVLLEVKNNE